MKNLKKIIIGASLITALSVHAFTGAALFNYQQNNQNEIVVEAAGPGNYYDSITDSMSGTTLLNALHTLNTQKTKKLVTYNGFRQFAAKSDKHPDSGNNKIVGFYNNSLVGPSWDSGSTWNREHMWPKSRNGAYVEDDAHMVRPTATSINSERGNMFFGFEGETYDPGQYVAEYRGIAARIIFYCAIADTSLKLVDLKNDDSSNGSMGKLSTLLAWNLQYAPDTSSTASLALRVEQRRNDIIQNDSDGQGNRNPFIDHPEYACKIWGNTNDATRAACAGVVPEPEQVAPTQILLESDWDEINVGETTQITIASITPEHATKTVEYISDDESVATVNSDGVVTALSKGLAIITVRSTVDTNVTTLFYVTVNDPNGGGNDSSSSEPSSQPPASSESGETEPPVEPSKKKGCGAEVMSMTIAIPIILGTAAILLFVFRKKGGKKHE